jgi:bile acid-coenzyme A ligase
VATRAKRASGFRTGFEPDEFLRLVTEHRVTFLATVPTVMQRPLPVYR